MFQNFEQQFAHVRVPISVPFISLEMSFDVIAASSVCDDGVRRADPVIRFQIAECLFLFFIGSKIDSSQTMLFLHFPRDRHSTINDFLVPTSFTVLFVFWQVERSSVHSFRCIAHR